MKLKEILTEMPQRIPPLNVKNAINYANSYLKILHNPLFNTKKIFVINDNISVYQSLHNDAGSFYAIYNENDNNQIILVMEYEMEHVANIGRIAKESLIWTSPKHKQFLKGIPKKIYFDYLIPLVHTYIGDMAYTSDGERFVKNVIIPTALQKRIYVYYIDTKMKQLILITDTSDLESLDNKHNIWSNTVEKVLVNTIFSHRRFIFSETPISI